MSWSPWYVVIQPFGNYLVEFNNVSLYFYVKSPFWYCHLIEYIVYIYLVWSSYGNLFHHLDWHLDLSFWIPSWDSKSVWINRPHISGWHTCQVRNVSSYNLILCLQVLSSHTFFWNEKTLYHTVYIRKCDSAPKSDISKSRVPYSPLAFYRAIFLFSTCLFQ